jgi:hypothetical protein
MKLEEFNKLPHADKVKAYGIVYLRTNIYNGMIYIAARLILE